MKAILNTKSTTYKHLNGQTFKVKQVLSTFVALELPNEFNGMSTTDFNFNEILIVDIAIEMQKAFDDQNWGNDCKTYNRLKDYCKSNKINTIEILSTFA